MRGKRQQVDVVRDDVDRDLADSLGGIGVEKDALFLADLANRLDVLDRADLVVAVHDAHQDRFVRDGFTQLVQIDKAVRLHGQVSHPRAVLFQPFTGIEDRLMLSGRGDNVVALLGIHLRHAFDGQIVRFRGPAGEDDLLRVRPDHIGQLFARMFHGLLGHPPKRVVAAGCVAKAVEEVWHHRLQDLGVHGVVA